MSVDPELLLTVLAELDTMRKAQARLEYEAVALVRAAGASWERIGDALGMSRQAAARKYGQPRKRLV